MSTLWPKTLGQSFRNDLILYLPMENHWQDVSGNGHHGTPTGASFSSTLQKEGSHCGVFNGVNNHVTISATGLPSSLSALTVGGYLYFNNFDGEHERIFDRGTETYLQKEAIGDRLNFRHNGVGDGSTVTTAALPEAQWARVMATWDGSKTAIYVKGSDTGDGEAATGTINYGADDMELGDHHLADRPVDGRMDGFGYWSRALSPLEVAQLELAGSVLAVEREVLHPRVLGGFRDAA